MAAKEKEKQADDEEVKEVTEGEGAEGEGGEEGGGKVKGKRKLIFIIAGVLLLAGVGAGLFFSGVLGGGEKKAKAEAAKQDAAATAAAQPTYYELPEFLVNLSTGTGKTSFLKMTVTLELKDPESKVVMDANKPRVLDTFNTYLREMRPSDLAGSAGIYRLREELIHRINTTVQDGIVKDILFSEIIIQ